MKQTSLFQSRLLVGLALSVAILSAVAAMVRGGLLRTAELEGYDLLILIRGSHAPPDNLVIVDFDDATVQTYKAFPIPRRLLAEVVENIAAGKPSVIGLDVILDLARSDSDDQELARALDRAGNVVLVSEHPFGRDAKEPLSIFRDAAAGVGFGDSPIDDQDGFIRRMYFQTYTPDYQGFSFAVAVASLYSGERLSPVRPGLYRFGATPVFAVERKPDSALINFYHGFPARIVSAQRLLLPGFDDGIFKGKIVLVGQSSDFGKDLFSTPVFRFRPPDEGRARLSGTEVHAAAISTLLGAATLRPMGTAPSWTLNLLLVWLSVTLVMRLRPWLGILAVLCVLGGTYLLATTLFSQAFIWMPYVSAEAGIALTLPAGLGYRFLEERRERGRLMSLFQRYVSPEAAAEIWKRRDEIILAGEERTATVLFSDIRSFTALTAGKHSAEVLSWLNRYLSEMSRVIKRNGGFLNKFIGDGIMVVFGVPLSRGVEDDACHAVHTALEMLDSVQQLNAQSEPGQPQIKIGVGIHTGVLTVGNVGATDRLEYSVIGETVNLASRLESLTKDFKTPIVLSPQTREAVLTRFATFSVGEAEVRGFQGKMEFFGVNREDKR
jgi:adenylate cyclase